MVVPLNCFHDYVSVKKRASIVHQTIGSIGLNKKGLLMPLFCFARARMGFVVDLGQVLEIKVCIDLGGADIRVSE